MTATEAVSLIEEDVNHAPQDAVVYAISRARLAKAVELALFGNRREAKAILDAEAETKLIAPIRNQAICRHGVEPCARCGADMLRNFCTSSNV